MLFGIVILQYSIINIEIFHNQEQSLCKKPRMMLTKVTSQQYNEDPTPEQNFKVQGQTKSVDGLIIVDFLKKP